MYKKAMIAAVLAGASAAANAQSAPSWYGGIDLGRSRIGLSGGDFENALSRQGIGASASSDRTDTSYGVNLGYRFTPNFALEGAYERLGKFSYNAAVSTPTADTVSGEYKANALSLAGVGILPLTREWSVYGKAGIARTHTELDSSASTVAVSNTSDNRNGLLIGAGVTYDFSRALFAKAGWDRYAQVGNDDTGKSHIDVYGVGVGVRF